MKYGDTNSESNKLENFELRKSIFLLLVSSFIFLMILSSVSALSATYSKAGADFSSVTGEYATSAHCSVGNTCTWISGNQVILGVYTGALNGGSATWNFNVTQPLNQITSAEIKISWPSVYGKGLHSVGMSTTSSVRVGSTLIASPVTSTAISCGTGDQYAFACFSAIPTYSVPVGAISSTTPVTITVPTNTLWDVGTIQLIINYSEPIACSTNAQCGANDWVAGTNSCSTNDVYQNFKTYTCNNPGTTSSSCSNSIAFNLKTDCGDTTYGSWGANYCSGNNVVKTRDVYNKGCASGACTASTTQETQTVLACANGCTSGTCNSEVIVCSTNSQCGANDWVASTNTCSNNDVYQNFKTFTCNNPGTAQSTCSNAIALTFKTDCGESGYGPWVTTCNTNIWVQTSRSVYQRGCSGGFCYTNEDNETLPLIYCQNGCLNGECKSSACWMDSQCGTSNWVAGTTQCYLNDVYQKYTTVSCKNPGYTNAICSSVTELKLKETCANGCTNAVCSATATGIKIINGKIRIDGTEFMIKGLDYAPWLYGTGPDATQGQKPFPATRTQDITDLVTSDGKVNVTDYSGDGRIQAWELIKFDVATMKKLGANTIRTYASGSWHDKDLDGIQDVTTNPNTSEIVQGDLTDWVLDELLTQANANNMKVIIGYWVQEENFTSYPYVADWSDLLVAQQAFGRVVNKYKSNPAVLGWGIGNEVNGSFNQGWFSWGVNVNDYLNALFAYTRTLDTNHPIIYAKYIGENTNFNNLTADIMSINTYIHSADDLVNKYGEFNIPAPQGKAYMLGEFGHLPNQTTGHWELAQNYAGGAFLEYNHVWWKGDNQGILGIVDEYRAINPERYNALNALYGGAPICSTNAECGTNTTGTNTCDGKNVVRTNTIFTCNNPGTQSSSCSTDQQIEVVQTCANSCLNGACVVPIACSTNAQCGINEFLGTPFCSTLYNIGQTYRSYTCINPGTAQSSCTFLDTNNNLGNCTGGQICSNAACVNIVCSNDLQCNDNNVQTTDKCLNPGTAQSVCENKVIPIIACSTNSDCGVNAWLNKNYCNSNNIWDALRTYTCTNPGAQNAICSSNDVNQLRTSCSLGQICNNATCVTPVCSNNAQCDDSNNLTVDVCVNPGTITSVCTHNPIVCSTNVQCGTNGIIGKVCTGNYLYDIQRTFTCNNAGASNSYCSSMDANSYNQTCTYGCLSGACIDAPIVCSTNLECNDNNALTVDTCVNPGTVLSACTHTPGVINCSTNSQCGTDAWILGTNTCSGNNVLQNYRTYTCANPGTISSSCSYNDTTNLLKTTCTSPQICAYGGCSTPVCNFDSNCGTSGFLPEFNCSGNDLSQKYRTYTCSNPGTYLARCNYADSLIFKETCSGGLVCGYGSCDLPTCNFDSNCNDNNPLTIDTCRNPATILSSCTHTPIVCASNANCNDNNSQTVDTCVNPNTVNSYCTNIKPAIACSTAAQCGASVWLNQENVCYSSTSVGDYFRTYKCMNPGKTTSYCKVIDTLKTKTRCSSGSLCSSGVCVKPICSSNTQCNDNDSKTIDVCVNPKKLNSVCTHTPIVCSTSIDCDDANSFTLDACKYPKTVKSYCTYTPIACANNLGCDDNNPLTIDKCIYPNKTNSKCTHTGIKCTSNTDCNDGNPLNSDVCLNPNTTKSECKFYPPIPETIWSRTPTSGGVYFKSTTCDVLTGKTCPNEMGWEGNIVTYAFVLPQGDLTDSLAFKFNVNYRNYGVSKNVLLRVSAGKSTTSLTVLNSSLDINRLGEFSVIIPKSLFAQGATNYIQLYGTNITPIGYGTNPPNFKISSISLNQIK